MKTKISMFLLTFIFLSFFSVSLHSQQRHQVELMINTEQMEEEAVTFRLRRHQGCTIVWDGYGIITSDSRILNPGDVTIQGNYDGNQEGWDGDCTNSSNPWIGRTDYY